METLIILPNIFSFDVKIRPLMDGNHMADIADDIANKLKSDH